MVRILKVLIFFIPAAVFHSSIVASQSLRRQIIIQGLSCEPSHFKRLSFYAFLWGPSFLGMTKKKKDDKERKMTKRKKMTEKKECHAAADC
jgi:hypothetical protein